MENLKRALNVQALGPNAYRSKVFDVVRFYMLARHVQLLEISSRLDRINESLRERARAGSPNDILLIYFQGKETEGQKGPILWTSETSPWLQLSQKDLAENYLARFPGGQVLLRDVMTTTEARASDVRDLRFALMRHHDPRPFGGPRPPMAASLARVMPRAATLDDLGRVLQEEVQPLQSYVPEQLRNHIRLNVASGGQE
jgi:hypothetical protein